MERDNSLKHAHSSLFSSCGKASGRKEGVSVLFSVFPKAILTSRERPRLGVPSSPWSAGAELSSHIISSVYNLRIGGGTLGPKKLARAFVLQWSLAK